MIPTDLPIYFERLNYHVQISYALTVNKSQGQTFSMIGFDLRKACFSHGRFYVNFSRLESSKNQYILQESTNSTTKLVYSEALWQTKS